MTIAFYRKTSNTRCLTPISSVPDLPAREAPLGRYKRVLRIQYHVSKYCLMSLPIA